MLRAKNNQCGGLGEAHLDKHKLAQVSPKRIHMGPYGPKALAGIMFSRKIRLPRQALVGS